MKKIYLILLFLSFLSYAQNEIKEENIIKKSLENPYSKALGQRIAGYALVGEGIVGIIMGIAFDNGDFFKGMYGDLGMSELGDFLDKTFWVEGAITTGIGLPLIIIGNIKYSKWKNWERNNTKISLSNDRIILEF